MGKINEWIILKQCRDEENRYGEIRIDKVKFKGKRFNEIREKLNKDKSWIKI